MTGLPTHPRPIRLRRPARLALAGVVAVALGACSDSSSDSPPAATVGGVEIPAQVLVDELEAIAANTAYVEAFESSTQGTELILAADGDGDEFVTKFVTDTLGVRIQYDIVGAEVERRGIEVDEACTEQSEQQLIARFSPEGTDGASLLDGFGDEYRDYLIQRNAEFLALQVDLSGITCAGGFTEEAIQAYFDANEEALTAPVACSSHILVETLDEAEEIAALLDDGADFAELASTRSIDTGSGAAGGDLGCNPQGRFVPEFEDAMFTQPVGEVGDPVATEFGFHIILVTERTTPTVDDVRADIEEALAAEVEATFAAWFTEALASTAVVVDTRYGDWDPATAAVVRPVPSGATITDSGEG